MAKQTFTTGQVLTAAQMTSLQQTAMGGGAATAKTASYVLVAADAGTVVQMNAAGATTITVNTALFAAGDSVQIQNIGAGVCTVTAGTATVSTSATLALKQYDAGTLYFNTTSAAIFFAVDAADGMTNPFTTTGDTVYASGGTTPTRLGIGSTGQVLTVASGIPSWATPASGGMTLLSTTTLSGTTTISSISQAYKNLVIQIYGISNATANGIFRATINSGYPVNSFAYRSQYATITTYATVTDYLQLTANVDTLRTDTANAFTITINDYANTSAATKTFTCNAGFLNSSSQLTEAFTMGQIVLGAGISAFSFSSVGGNLSTGTVLIYGVS